MEERLLAFNGDGSEIKPKGMMQRWLFAMVFGVLTVAGSSLDAQSATAFARMNQDVQLLTERVKKLSLSVEVMEQENERLRRTLEAQVKAHAALLSRFEAYRASIDARLDGLPAREAAMKKEIISEVTRELKQFAAAIQKQLDALAKAIGSQPQIGTVHEFDEDYPQEGVAYEVQRGDTLSGIAKKFNSTVRDIQNANRIANPAQLQAGQTIFVPQRKPQ